MLTYVYIRKSVTSEDWHRLHHATMKPQGLGSFDFHKTRKQRAITTQLRASRQVGLLGMISYIAG